MIRAYDSYTVFLPTSSARFFVDRMPRSWRRCQVWIGETGRPDAVSYMTWSQTT
jgi:hypothetical protein